MSPLPPPHSKNDLLEILERWHREPSPELPAPFPGPLAGKDKLSSWVYDIRKRAEEHSISRQQWANAILAWIPATPAGKTGFKERLLKCLRKRRATGQLENGRFWKWEDFKLLFFHLCGEEVIKHRAVIGAVAVGSAIALPVVGIPLLGAIGFTSTGIAGGSIAAALQSAVYGGATGGAFSVLQSIGAQAAFPVAWNAAAAALGGAAAATRGQGGAGDHDIASYLGDIGDDPVDSRASL